MANRIKGITVEIGGDTTEQLQNGEISQEQYDALQREIAERQKSSIIADAIRSIGTLCRIVWCGKYYSKRRKR